METQVGEARADAHHVRDRVEPQPRFGRRAQQNNHVAAELADRVGRRGRASTDSDLVASLPLVSGMATLGPMEHFPELVRSRRTHKSFRPEPVQRETLDDLLERQAG